MAGSEDTHEIITSEEQEQNMDEHGEMEQSSSVQSSSDQQTTMLKMLNNIMRK